jgi:predicted outer membrane repeat protein
VSGNRATDFATGRGNGGGIFAGAGQLSLLNSTVSGNNAVHFGGAIYAGNLDLLNVTLVKNSAQSAGGIFHGSATLPATIRNTIVALNRIGPGGSSPDVSGLFTSLGHNLIGDSSDHPAFINGVNGDQVGQPDKPLNPKIGRLADNGGPTRTHALLRRSPAIDAGDNNDAPRKDQRGVRRPRDGDGRRGRIVDIGAFER